MKYLVLYKTDDGKNRFERVEASSKKEAEKIVRSKWNDIDYIVDVQEA